MAKVVATLRLDGDEGDKFLSAVESSGLNKQQFIRAAVLDLAGRDVKRVVRRVGGVQAVSEHVAKPRAKTAAPAPARKRASTRKVPKSLAEMDAAAPGDRAAAKAARDAPPSRRVAASSRAKQNVRPIPKRAK